MDLKVEKQTGDISMTDYLRGAFDAQNYSCLIDCMNQIPVGSDPDLDYMIGYALHASSSDLNSFRQAYNRIAHASAGGCPSATEFFATIPIDDESVAILRNQFTGIVFDVPTAFRISHLQHYVRALRGDPISQYSIGCEFCRGVYTRVDLKQAIYWLTLSAAGKSAFPDLELVRIYGNPESPEFSLDLCESWILKARNKGIHHSMIRDHIYLDTSLPPFKSWLDSLLHSAQKTVHRDDVCPE
ncbi:MAG TPA: hypothetical protein VM597_17315 [Gemmataceae bacterium]|nr:hypothetical protein [Gemmataceae bacterium]